MSNIGFASVVVDTVLLICDKCKLFNFFAIGNMVICLWLLSIWLSSVLPHHHSFRVCVCVSVCVCVCDSVVTRHWQRLVSGLYCLISACLHNVCLSLCDDVCRCVHVGWMNDSIMLAEAHCGHPVWEWSKWYDDSSAVVYFYVIRWLFVQDFPQQIQLMALYSMWTSVICYWLW